MPLIFDPTLEEGLDPTPVEKWHLKQWFVQIGDAIDASTNNSGLVFRSRTEAVAAGQAAIPANVKAIMTLEGTALVLRGWTHTDDDPLFETTPRFGVVRRWDVAAESASREAAVASLEMSRRRVLTAAGITPLLVAGSRVLLWAEAGEIKGPGLGGGSDMMLVRAYAEPRRSPRDSNLPIMTDGRSLHRLRGAMGKLKAGISGTKPRIALVGDSWMELNPLPVALRDSLAADYPMGGWGWWPATPAARFSNTGAGYVRSAGWAFMDASAGTSLIYGAGPDGNLATATGAAETLTLQGVILTELRIYTRQWGGTWRYRVDGGAWTVVAESNSGGALRITTISGLSDAAHTIEIDTTGNTGRVAFAGFLLGRGTSGVEVLRMGNGGVRGIHLTETAPHIAAVGADLAPDVVIVSLGTNDYRYADGVSAYIKGLRDLRNGWRAGSPDCGFVFMSPPLSGGTVVTPQAEFRDALYEMCLADGHEFYNGTDDWPAYEVSNAQGLWDDNLHPGAAGAHALVGRLRQLMGV